MRIKSRIEELVLLGGAAPASDVELYVGRPNVGSKERFIGYVEDIFDRKWLTNNGRYVQEFESRLASYIGVKHCIAMANATIGLEIAIRALGLHGEVLVPSFTFVATAHALQWQEITPVFCDIDPATHTIDANAIEKMITPRTTGIIGVHLWGRSCNVEDLSELARKHHLKLMFDSAHALGCTRNGVMIGGFGNLEVFSFHATKFMNTFEGGAVTTNDDELASKIRLMKNFGFSGYDNVIYPGTNGKMTEICAAMGLVGLDSIDDFIETNKDNYNLYRDYLADVPGVDIVVYGEDERNNYQYVILEVDEARAGLSRDELVRVLHAENIIARRYFYPGCHKMEPYKSLFPHAGMLLPETERLTSRVMSLPTGSSIGQEEIAGICRLIRLTVDNAEAVRNNL